MKVFIFFLFILPLQASDLPKANPEQVGMSSQKLEMVDEKVKALVEKKRIAGASVMIARKGRVCFEEVYGLMDVERNKPMASDTLFRIYSMTKAITSAAVLQLHEQGKLNVKDAVGKYIPKMKTMKVYTTKGVASAKETLRIDHLLTHTDGLLYQAKGEYGALLKKADAMNKQHGLDVMAKRMGQTPLRTEPGAEWLYGTGTDVLGYLVEIVSGQNLKAYFAEHIFEPLGMKDTDFYVSSDKVERFAAHYSSNGRGKLTLKDDPQDSAYLTNPALKSGGGGLVSTISDYMRFMLAISLGGELEGQRILKRETVDLMTTNQLPKKLGWIKFGKEVRDGIGFGYGFSVCVEKSQFAPNRKVGDYGWGGMASTHYWVSPQDDLVVITMEQTVPYSFLLEKTLKPVISAAIVE